MHTQSQKLIRQTDRHCNIIIYLHVFEIEANWKLENWMKKKEHKVVKKVLSDCFYQKEPRTLDDSYQCIAADLWLLTTTCWVVLLDEVSYSIDDQLCAFNESENLVILL